jgi:hypothetical protein
MARVSTLVSVLGRIHPAAFDAIFPHGPIQVHRGAFGRSSIVGMFSASASELNPQPLPPKAELEVAAAVAAREIAFAALNAEATGNESGRLLKAAIDDWCGNGRPRFPIPWPGPWPFPFPFPPEPEPHPEWDVATSQVVGALSLAAVASRLPIGDTRDALMNGAQQLLDVAVG